MRCENNFCVYCSQMQCTLDCISINNIGLCEECILINIDDEIINVQKKKMFIEYEK